MSTVFPHFLQEYEVQSTAEVKQNLYHVMASVQDSVNISCLSYFERFRRTTHVTPKSFMSFLISYKEVNSVHIVQSVHTLHTVHCRSTPRRRPR